MQQRASRLFCHSGIAVSSACYDPFGKPTVYGGSSNLGLVPETYLKDTEGMKLEEIEGVAN